MADGAPVIEARELGKRFGEREALRGVSFGAAPGELLAVIGPNGAGKTTLLSILAGILEPDAGLVEEQRDGVGEQADRDVDPLLVAARERARLIVTTIAEAGLLEHLPDR